MYRFLAFFAVLLSLQGSLFGAFYTFGELDAFTQAFQENVKNNQWTDKDLHALKKALPFVEQKNFETKGFLYKNSQGRWILSPEPNLKSCCVNSKKRLLKKIYLNGSFEAHRVNQMIGVSGEFMIEKKVDKEGKVEELFVLNHPVVIESTRDYKTLAWVAFWMAIAGIVLYLIVKK